MSCVEFISLNVNTIFTNHSWVYTPGPPKAPSKNAFDLLMKGTKKLVLPAPKSTLHQKNKLFNDLLNVSLLKYNIINRYTVSTRFKVYRFYIKSKWIYRL